MRLFIAEKPSLARAIAGGVGEITKKTDAHIQVGNDWITWCFGHILELAPPEAYAQRWRPPWTLSALPITVGPDEWKLSVRGDAKKQYDAIGALLRMADEVVNAGDPDREGQMLIDEVLESHGWKGKTTRILIANATPQGVRDAMKKMQPNSDFRPLYEAAMCRARADWLVGMNFTRAATKRIGPMTSVGRVQTPTLSLVVKRDKEIESHTVSHYYPLHAHVQTVRGGLVAVHDPKQNRITSIDIAKGIAKELEGSRVKLTMVSKQEREHAPLPFILATFSSAAEDAFGWGAKESLEVLQSLYEKQMVTYPRTDCPYLPADHAKQARRIAESIIGTGLMPVKAADLLSHMAPKPNVYDDAKVEEHHGVIPTLRMPGGDLAPKLLDGWRLVARRFLQTLMPSLIKDVAEVFFVHEDRRFTSRGEKPINAAESWVALEPEKDGPKGEQVQPLSLSGPVTEGDVLKVEIKKNKTSPPKRYTEATLIADMKNVAKFVTNEKLKAILKETSGIGTAATQASIIETLKHRGYIRLDGAGKKKHIISTPFGRYLVENLPAALCDPGITAAWEDALQSIAKREMDAGGFMQKIEAYVSKYVEHLKTVELSPLPESARPSVNDRARGRKGSEQGRRRA